MMERVVLEGPSASWLTVNGRAHWDPTTVMHDELPGLPPDILPDGGEGHVEREDDAIAEDLVQLIGTRARVMLARACGGRRAAVD